MYEGIVEYFEVSLAELSILIGDENISKPREVAKALNKLNIPTHRGVGYICVGVVDHLTSLSLLKSLNQIASDLILKENDNHFGITEFAKDRLRPIITTAQPEIEFSKNNTIDVSGKSLIELWLQVCQALSLFPKVEIIEGDRKISLTATYAD